MKNDLNLPALVFVDPQHPEKRSKSVKEKTILTALVNLKCKGMFGRCLRPFTQIERQHIVNEMVRRGWIDDKINILPCGENALRGHLDLCEK